MRTPFHIVNASLGRPQAPSASPADHGAATPREAVEGRSSYDHAAAAQGNPIQPTRVPGSNETSIDDVRRTLPSPSRVPLARGGPPCRPATV